MHQRLEALNAKLLALNAQLSVLQADFIELSKSLSDLSAELEAQSTDAQLLCLQGIQRRAALMRKYGFVPRKAYVDGQHQRIWVRA
jgi:hypothetical protein